MKKQTPAHNPEKRPKISLKKAINEELSHHKITLAQEGFALGLEGYVHFSHHDVSFSAKEEAEQSVNQPEDDVPLLEGVYNLDKELSLEEAFVIAREKVGPGGFFIWEDHAYSTFTPDEWYNLEAAGQGQYIESVQEALHSHIENNHFIQTQTELAHSGDTQNEQVESAYAAFTDELDDHPNTTITGNGVKPPEVDESQVPLDTIGTLGQVGDFDNSADTHDWT